MNVLSLFDGMSCGQLALESIDISNTYFASEIDKHAIKVAMGNYPNTNQLGDVKKITQKDIPKIHLLLGGSPCQGFSYSGKRLNFQDERSVLFFEYVRLLEECQPEYFLLENVKMSKSSQDIITKYLGVEPVLINSSSFTAQYRPRLYWTNIPIKPYSDHNVLLPDILEYDTGEIETFANHVRKNIIGIDVMQHLKKNGFITIPVKTGYQDHKIGVTKSPCLRASKSFTLVRCPSGGIRLLTVTEWERLQGVRDGYTNFTSKTQRYKMLGNGWTVPVISHILKGIK